MKSQVEKNKEYCSALAVCSYKGPEFGNLSPFMLNTDDEEMFDYAGKKLRSMVDDVYGFIFVNSTFDKGDSLFIAAKSIDGDVKYYCKKYKIENDKVVWVSDKSAERVNYFGWQRSNKAKLKVEFLEKLWASYRFHSIEIKDFTTK